MSITPERIAEISEDDVLAVSRAGIAWMERAQKAEAALDAERARADKAEGDRDAFDWWLEMFWMNIVQDASSLYFVNDPGNYRSHHFTTRKEAVMDAFKHFTARAAQSSKGEPSAE